MNPSLTERFAEYATALAYEDLSPEAILLVKRLLYDSLATGLGGYQTVLGKKAARFATTQTPGGEASLIGEAGGQTAEGAAFANATMIKILGMDDSHRTGSHIAAQVLPATLAVCERDRVSGREMIVAIVAAYDLAVRVGTAVRVETRRRGLDIKGTVGAIAATVAAGRCAGLTAKQLASALGLAADMASGTEQYVYEAGDCDTKDLVAGFAARNGVFATRLAAHGFFGPRGGLDGEYGFFRAFGSGTPAGIFDDLGRHFAILTTGFKPHGGCRHTHQAADAVAEILKRVPVNPGDIARVVIKTYRSALQPDFRIAANPESGEVAGLSIRVATALALVRRSTWPADFEHWDDPEVRRLRRVTDVEIDREIEAAYPEKNGCRVLLFLRDGRQHEGFAPFAKGEPEFPMTDADLREKFGQLTQAILPPDRAEEIRRLCYDLETLPEPGPLMRLTHIA